ncbi:uncharacterized protein ARMOST_03179 [Armillaria ostoyae]|uniref:Ubiquitin-like domain-containing protein n=1 Tax=Armillaria ostoyae TaxID=47428 RepID=A0A284QTR4_ARMOS|nr:uncharacterized protein ARMOST_03179 [Armillaria ostoyae]
MATVSLSLLASTSTQSDPLIKDSPNWDTNVNLPTLQDLLQPSLEDIATSSGEQKTFKIKQTTKLDKMLHYFASSYGKEPSAFKFIYDGQRIDPEWTAEMYEMEDEDVIDAMIEHSYLCALQLLTDMSIEVGGSV